MGIVIPDSALGDRAYGINAGEKYLLNKLKAALPDDCILWHNIPAYWLVQSAASKKDYDAAQDRVLISTVHSAKGRDSTFPLDYLNERENASMIYVAMTRAKKNLTIVSGSRTETFSRIKETVQKYCAA